MALSAEWLSCERVLVIGLLMNFYYRSQWKRSMSRLKRKRKRLWQPSKQVCPSIWRSSISAREPAQKQWSEWTGFSKNKLTFGSNTYIFDIIFLLQIMLEWGTSPLIFLFCTVKIANFVFCYTMEWTAVLLYGEGSSYRNFKENWLFRNITEDFRFKHAYTIAAIDSNVSTPSRPCESNLATKHRFRHYFSITVLKIKQPDSQQFHNFPQYPPKKSCQFDNSARNVESFHALCLVPL